MKRQNHPQIVSANDLLAGFVVYLGETDWVRHINEAQIFATKDDAEAALAKHNDPNRIIGAYLVDRPANALHIREAIRADGPTITYASAK